MIRTGVLSSAHDNFSSSLLQRIRAVSPEIAAEALTPKDLPQSGPAPWAVIFDRLSARDQSVRPALINAAATGTRVINNPLRPETADESRSAAVNKASVARASFTQYFRCCVVGSERVHVMRYDPNQPEHLCYVAGNPAPEPHLGEAMVEASRKLAHTLGYDFCMVEFGVIDDVPSVADVFEPDTEANFESVGSENYEWILNAAADLVVSAATAKR